MQITKVAERERKLSGLPVPKKQGLSWWRQLLANPWLYAVVGLTVVSALLLWHLYRIESTNMMAQVNELTEGQEGLNARQIREAMRHGLVLALPTASAYVVGFLLIDRWRPMPWYLKYISFIWGGAVAVYLSFFFNSWAGEKMTQMASLQDPLAGSRAAPFSAPFVEEAAKGSILIVLAIFAAYRIVSPLQTVCLSGLSAVGFAFTENIVYYYRQFVALSIHPSMPDVDAQMANLVKMRGLVTSFGHPTFTAFIGIGVYLLLRNRSKWVRVLAPITGFLFAALGHMIFNGVLSVFVNPADHKILATLYIFALMVAICLLGYLIRQLFAQGKLITYRLLDYGLMGWLTPRDAMVFNNLFRRTKLTLAALFRGRKTIVATRKMIRSQTELAYLRDGIARGLIGRGGNERQRELVDQIRALRGVALDEPFELHIIPRPIFGKWRYVYRKWRETRQLRRSVLNQQVVN